MQLQAGTAGGRCARGQWISQGYVDYVLEKAASDRESGFTSKLRQRQGIFDIEWVNDSIYEYSSADSVVLRIARLDSRIERLYSMVHVEFGLGGAIRYRRVQKHGSWGVPEFDRVEIRNWDVPGPQREMVETIADLIIREPMFGLRAMDVNDELTHAELHYNNGAVSIDTENRD